MKISTNHFCDSNSRYKHISFFRFNYFLKHSIFKTNLCANLPKLKICSILNDYSKAKKELGWTPKIKFKELVRLMVESDVKKLNLSCV